MEADCGEPQPQAICIEGGLSGGQPEKWGVSNQVELTQDVLASVNIVITDSNQSEESTNIFIFKWWEISCA